MSVVGTALRWLLAFILRVFFKEITIVSAKNVPKTGPLILTGNHQNQLVDGAILYVFCNRDVSLLAAKKTYDRPLTGLLLRAAHAVPVERRIDHTKAGPGTIVFTTERLPSGPVAVVARGVGTNFVADFKEGDELMADHARFASWPKVLRINSATEMIVEFVPEPEEGAPPVEGRTMPYKLQEAMMKQDAMFDAVYHKLNEGGAMGIFPEGISHDRSEMQKLKPGAAVMALGARVNGGADVTIVPVGFNYFGGHRFRSRVMVQFGDPITIAPEVHAMYQQNLGNKHNPAVATVMSSIERGLKAVTLNAPDWETLETLYLMRKLYCPLGKRFDAGDFLELSRRFQALHEQFHHEEELHHLEEDLHVYSHHLAAFHIKDKHVANGYSVSRRRLFLAFILRLLSLLVLGALSVPGFVLNLPISLPARTLAYKEGRIGGRDVVATQKILAAFVLVPVLYGVYTLIAVYYYGWPALFIAPLLLLLLGYSTIRVSELSYTAFKSSWSVLSLALGRRKEDVMSLPALRDELQGRVREFVRECAAKDPALQAGLQRFVTEAELKEDTVRMQKLRQRQPILLHMPHFGFSTWTPPLPRSSLSATTATSDKTQ